VPNFAIPSDVTRIWIELWFTYDWSSMLYPLTFFCYIVWSRSGAGPHSSSSDSDDVSHHGIDEQTFKYSEQSSDWSATRYRYRKTINMSFIEWFALNFRFKFTVKLPWTTEVSLRDSYQSIRHHMIYEANVWCTVCDWPIFYRDDHQIHANWDGYHPLREYRQRISKMVSQRQHPSN
jgi:hypothetical protein